MGRRVGVDLIDSRAAVGAALAAIVRYAPRPDWRRSSYVQRLRSEDAKRRLERTEASVDEIGWRVGYEDSAFFRRLFKRTTGMAPGAYRKRFRIPEFARA